MASAYERRIVPPATHGPEAAHGLGLGHGMWGVVIFIASEVMFFAALFTAYFYLRAQSGGWPPHGSEIERPGIWPFRGTFEQGWLVTLNTIVLVSSSFTMQLGVNRLKAGDHRRFVRMLAITLVMGVAFLIGQFGFEYPKLIGEHLVPQAGLFGSVFYTLTGFHGAHVTGGVVFMGIVLIRALRGQFDAHRHLAVEASSIYWHFVDIVWIGLVTTIYVL